MGLFLTLDKQSRTFLQKDYYGFRNKGSRTNSSEDKASSRLLWLRIVQPASIQLDPESWKIILALASISAVRVGRKLQDTLLRVTMRVFQPVGAPTDSRTEGKSPILFDFNF
jgi:hypothetical protein